MKKCIDSRGTLKAAGSMHFFCYYVEIIITIAWNGWSGLTSILRFEGEPSSMIKRGIRAIQMRFRADHVSPAAVSKGCTPNYLPAFIAMEVKKRQP